jgi:hypothetical protein
MSYEMGIVLDEYEKSLYLTDAQTKIYDELIGLFEVNGDISKDLEPFITEANITIPLARTSLFDNGVFFNMPSDVHKVVLEEAVLSAPTVPLLNGRRVKVIKTKLAEVSRKLQNPFREPNGDEVLRILTYDEVANSAAELIVPDNTTISSYRIKYISDITPIILENLPDGLEIMGLSVATNTKFDDIILDKIIDLSIQLILKDKSIFAPSGA